MNTHLSNDPIWVTLARQMVGLREVPGAPSNPEIVRMWHDIKRSGIKDDATPWCFTGETELLTENGWVRFDRLAGEQVYQVAPSGELSLVAPIMIVKDYRGDVFDINHRSIRLTCDVGHRWWGQWGKREYLSFGTLDQISVDGLHIPTVQSSATGVDLDDDQLCLLAAFICDGKHRYSNGKGAGTPWSIDFEVSRQRKIDELRRLRPDHEYTQRKVYGHLSRTPLTVFRFAYPLWFSSCFSDYKQLSKQFVHGLSAQQARVFLTAFAKFDGNDSATKTVLYTADEQLMHDLVTIATFAGYHPSIQMRGQTGLSNGENWAVCFSPAKRTRSLDRKHVSRRQFSGMLYCVQVPHERIVVRGPGASPVVTGNCAAFAGAMLERAGIRSSRFESAKSYLDWGVRLDGPAHGCIVVFTREGGGHVGFVVGQDSAGRLLVLGGNQGDSVSIKAFPRDRVSGYRYPVGFAIPNGPLMVLAGAEISRNEA